MTKCDKCNSEKKTFPVNLKIGKMSYFTAILCKKHLTDFIFMYFKSFNNFLYEWEKNRK